MSCLANSSAVEQTESYALSTETNNTVFTNILGQGRVNQLGGVFINGRPLPPHKRLQIIDMARAGVRPCMISRQLRISHGCVSKILYRFMETGSISPGQVGGNRSRFSVSDVERKVVYLKRESPHMSNTEIRQKLIDTGFCEPSKAPLTQSIAKILRTHEKEEEGKKTLPPPEKKAKFHSIEQLLAVDDAGAAEDYDDSTSAEQKNRRNRTSFTPDQLSLLEQAFQANRYPEQETRKRLAQQTQLSENKIVVWFSNRRARWRKNFGGIRGIAAMGAFAPPLHPMHSPFAIPAPSSAMPQSTI